MLQSIASGWRSENFGARVTAWRVFAKDKMRVSERLVTVLVLATLFVATPVVAQKQLAQSPQILSAKTIYFSNQTNSSAVGTNALAELKKWGKFQVVQERNKADLILLLSMEPYKEGDDISQGGGSGDLDDGDESRIPKWNRQKPTQYAYLTVIDPKTGASLWSAEHLWGGLLTGFNSAGVRLVKELEKQTKK
jgi:hypothetical protein